jgi:hypothetical protein
VDDARSLLALPLAHVTGFAVATLTPYTCGLASRDMFIHREGRRRWLLVQMHMLDFRDSSYAEIAANELK